MEINVENSKNNSTTLRLRIEFFLTQIKSYMVYLVLIVAIGAVLGGVITIIEYKPEYSASQVFSIELADTDVKGEGMTNTQLAKTVPSLFSSDAFILHMKPYLDEQDCTGKFHVYSISSTDLFCLNVIAPSNRDCDIIISTFKEHYSEVADEIIGVSKIDYFTQASKKPFPSNSPHYLRAILIGLVGGLVLGFALIYLKTRLTEVVTSQDEAESYINSKCLASIKTVNVKKRSGDKNKKRQQMPLITHADCPLELKQSISTIASKIDFECAREGKNTILFTSSISGEGKSSIATNTAIELSKMGKRVLIIDADLRSPSVLSCLGVEDVKATLSSAILGNADVNDAVFEKDGLFALADIQPDENAFENITNKRFGEIIEELKQDFDYVIIDSSPVGILGDSITISDYADYYIYVISFNYVSKSSVRYGLSSLTSSNADMLGFVINYTR